MSTTDFAKDYQRAIKRFNKDLAVFDSHGIVHRSIELSFKLIDKDATEEKATNIATDQYGNYRKDYDAN